MKFQTNKNNIAYLGDNFKEQFGDMDFKLPKKFEIETKTLPRYMTNQEILDELKPSEITLGELMYAHQHKLLSKDTWNLCFIRNKEGELWLVDVCLDSDGWSFGADPLGYSYRWDDGHRVIRGKFKEGKVGVEEVLPKELII